MIEHGESGAISSGFMLRVFYALAALAIASLGISVTGKWLGASLAQGGHTEDGTLKEIVIGKNVLAVPANAIRFESARHDGIARRLDLYLRWPDLNGYTGQTRDDFNNAHGRRNILFLTFEPAMMSRDMSGRWDPIYSRLVERPAKPLRNGINLFSFTEKSGYLNEALAVAFRPNDSPFVARCLIGPEAELSLAPCERDIWVGEGLSLTYRFPRELLESWELMDATLVAKTREYLQSGG